MHSTEYREKEIIMGSQKSQAYTLYEAYVATQRPRVLLAEDDAELRQLLSGVLRRDGFEVLEARDGNELLSLIGREIATRGEQGFSLIVSDIRMPGFTGMTILAGLRRADWPTPVMLITGFGDPNTHREAERLGAAAVFDKPFDMDDFRTAVVNLIGSGAEASR
jgi:DNA-binding NtrC family response regulator